MAGVDEPFEGCRRLIVIAGPNGAGKSTLTRGLSPDIQLIDPDAIAREEGLSPVAAGRAALQRMWSCIENGKSLAVETTLSGQRLFAIMEMARKNDFGLQLHFVGIDNPELALERVRQRVACGGHDVPEKDLRRRFSRSFQNLPRAIQICDTSYIYDNSGSGHKMLAIVSRDAVSISRIDFPYPSWFETLLDDICQGQGKWL